MIVKKFKNTLHLKLETEDEEFFGNDELFWNDLYVETSGGWLYLLDTNRNKVVQLNDYYIEELKSGKTVILPYLENDPDYEFNTVEE